MHRRGVPERNGRPQVNSDRDMGESDIPVRGTLKGKTSKDRYGPTLYLDTCHQLGKGRWGVLKGGNIVDLKRLAGPIEKGAKHFSPSTA